jgi:AcrR family transcriptional regulator
MSQPQADQKLQILNASFQLYMKRGIRSVSMDDLARHLGISKKTIYLYYENKDALVSAMVISHIDAEKKEVQNILSNSENAIDEMQQIARMALRTLSEVSSGTMFDLQKYYRKQWTAVTDLHKNFLHAIITQNIERGVREGIYRPEINAEIIARLYGEMAFSIVNDDVFSMQNFNMQEVYTQAFHYHINGILSPKGDKIFQTLNAKAE